ncbi:cell division protein FtsA [Aquirufa nivalisilvae]|uniref:Cell division protein FtsA n=1 Tax=Aquirufa nivalisilvae TaxID=2516557 RepID=A0A2S2DSZ5_9BACT|nr:cell division protein FtsA [Aquirufa nivalisilvae]AWL08478.1 Cell division protein FtsA [Aquirufa nivalisilvae]TBH75878.1 cell division protein FtsA [Aquirufa nivalisilvae]
MRNDLIIGLDIGSSFVRAVAGRQNASGKLEIIASGKANTIGNILQGEIVNIHKTTAAIAEALKKISGALEGKNTDYYFASNLSGSHINVQPYSSTKIRKNPREAVSLQEVYALIDEAKKPIAEKNPCILHTLPIGFKVDNLPTTLDPVGQIGQKIQADFMVVTANPDKYGLLVQCLVAAESDHIKKGNVYFSPIAASTAVLSPEEKEEGVVLVDIGSGTTEISVYQNKRLVQASILNWGGDRLTEDIRIGLNVSLENAEALKTTFGSAVSKLIDINEVVMIPGIAGRKPTPISVKNLAIILEERLKELAAKIVAEISKVGEPQTFKSGIVLCGGGAQLPDIAELFQKVTDLECRIGVPMVVQNSHASEEIHDPSFATAIGLVQVYYEQLDQAIPAEDHEPATIGDSQKESGKGGNDKPGIKNIFSRVVDVLMGSNEAEGEY